MMKIRTQDKDKLPEDAKNIEKLIEYKNMMISTIESRTPEQRKGWNQKQAYIAMGVILTTAALLGIDACPMEGFDPEKYNEIL
jgi:nitroreductase